MAGRAQSLIGKLGNKARKPGRDSRMATNRLFLISSPADKDDSPVPCFYWKVCGTFSAVEKGGKSVCRAHAAGMSGQEYPLRTAREARDGSRGQINIIEWEIESLRRTN